MIKRYKCTISYDGRHFSGFQIQPNKRTIQGEIEAVLTKMHKDEMRIHASGRTDAGVHARGQVFHFDSKLDITVSNWKRALNSMLPDDIYINRIEIVSNNFHARFDAVEKEYHYLVLNSKERNVFMRHYAYFNPSDFKIDKMKKACKKFEGTHDFTSFSSHRTTVKGSKVRTLYEVTCKRKGDYIYFVLRGNGFLYNMVRIIVGTLLDIGLGHISIDDIDLMFKEQDRRVASKTTPPEGLYLHSVNY